MQLSQQFLYEISRCKDPMVFMGLTRVLCVSWYEEDVQGAGPSDQSDCPREKTPRSFVSLLEDVMKQYDKAPRKLKRELLKCLRDANNTGDVDAGNTENTETPVQT